MKLYPEMNEKIKDMLRIGNNPIDLYAAEYIEKLEKEKDLAIARLKQAADDNGGCYGCKWFDWETEKCENPKGIDLCDAQTNNMWKWEGLEE